MTAGKRRWMSQSIPETSQGIQTDKKSPESAEPGLG